MFLELGNNSGKLQISAGNFKTAGNFKITLLTTSLSHVIISSIK